MLPVTFVTLILICSVNCSDEVICEEIMEKIRFMFPYCRIGEAQNGAGVYYAPFAAYKFGELATYGSPLEKEAFDLYLQEIFRGYRLDLGRNSEGITFILDCAGLDLNDLLAPNAFEISMKIYAISGENSGLVKKFIIINMGLSPELFGTIWNPLLGDLRSKTQMYGNNPEEWVPHLRDSIPSHVLFVGYGGTNPMPPKCNRAETRRPFRFPTVETFNSAITFIAQIRQKLLNAGGNGFSVATGSFPPACTLSRCIWLNECS